MEDKITIIEGPTPTFEAIHEGWVLGLAETPNLTNMAVTRLRTFNGPQLVERCHRAWRDRENIYLEYRGEDGLERSATIVAARYLDVDEGHLLLLWVRLLDEDVQVEYDFEDTDLEDGLEINFDDEDDYDYDEDEDFDEDDFDLGDDFGEDEYRRPKF